MTFFQAATYPLYFRNSHVWDSLALLLSNDRYIGAEFLIRPLLEGVTKFEWCMLDVEKRSWRFRLTSMESTLEYLELKPSAFDKQRISNLRGAVAALKAKGIKRMPPMQQLSADLESSLGDKWYGFFKYFSKLVHSEFENWGQFEEIPGEPEHDEGTVSSGWQTINCQSFATFLQMRNIKLMGMLFEPMKYSDVGMLEATWSSLFYSLLADEQYNPT